MDVSSKAQWEGDDCALYELVCEAQGIFAQNYYAKMKVVAQFPTSQNKGRTLGDRLFSCHSRKRVHILLR